MLLVAVFVSSLNSYFQHKKLMIGLYLAFLVVCLIFPLLLCYLPLVSYDLFFTQEHHWQIFLLIPLVIYFTTTSWFTFIWLLLLLILSILLKHRSIVNEKLSASLYALRDRSREQYLELESNHREVMEKQDYEVKLATLAERNRIARDIHDHVGHSLSSSILQIGALATISENETAKSGLTTLKNTLSDAMDSIRNSVHDLHEQSFSLELEIERLINGFSFCEVELQYELTNDPNPEIKSHFIVIIKEALANVIKHSNATKVTITLREHPAFLQLVIQDNGSKMKSISSDGDGIGLKNMTARIAGLGGHIHVSYETGFKIFISVSKK